MREGWEYKKLVDVCSIQYGYPFDSANFTTCDKDMPLIRIRDVKEGKTCTYYKGDYPTEYIVKKGDYLIGMDGEFNIAPWNSSDALLNQRVCKVFKKSDNISIEFTYRFLTKELKLIEDETPFVTVKHLSAKRLNQVIIPLPPLSTQQQIVEELDLLSGIIEKKRQQLKEYEALAESIFYDMFGDPVENPKGWEKKTLDYVCESIVRGPFGSALKKDFFVPKTKSSYKVYEQKHAIQKNASLGDYYISSQKFEELKRFEVKPDDIIMSCSGTIGEMFVIPKESERGVMNQALLKFTLKPLISNIYFLFFMDSFKSHIEVKGTGLQNIGSVKYIKETLVPLPPLSLQQSFAAKIEALEQQKQLIKESLKETETLFQSRMDYWFNS